MAPIGRQAAARRPSTAASTGSQIPREYWRSAYQGLLRPHLLVQFHGRTFQLMWDRLLTCGGLSTPTIPARLPIARRLATQCHSVFGARAPLYANPGIGLPGRQLQGDQQADAR